MLEAERRCLSEQLGMQKRALQALRTRLEATSQA